MNNGHRPLTLVLPGDGSVDGWRTPLIEWTFSPGGDIAAFGHRGCGNINGLRPGEVFNLPPGEARDLGGCIEPPWLPATSRFRAVMTYVNQPDLPFRGVPLPAHDESELARVRDSHRCRVRSNEIEIIFEDDPGDGGRIWFSELATALRRRWSGSATNEELIALRDELQQELQSIRADRGIKPAFMWLVADPSRDTLSATRVRQWCDEPQITVRGVILALGRFDVADAHDVAELDRRWRLFRKERGLDVYGGRGPTPPMQPTGSARG